MLLYPASAATQLEFEKVKELVKDFAETDYAQQKALQLRIHTQMQYIQTELYQTHEFKLLLQQGVYFPLQFTINIQSQIKLLGINGACLSAEQFLQIVRLCQNMEGLFRWFNNDNRMAYPYLTKILEESYYEKSIKESIEAIIDEGGNVKDNASDDLQRIRLSLYKKRNELRRVFEKCVVKLQKAGYSADIEESFSNGRRVVAVFSEHKRQVKGILHGESDSRKTAFIEPEETIELNNLVYSLENEEAKEIFRILKQLTQQLSIFSELLQQYLTIIGEFDFIKAKARLALEINAQLPNLVDAALIDLQQAYHPLLLLYNKANNKPTIPVNLQLNQQQRILVISGPNAGGKTVTMKTIGLNQMLLQAGLLVPVSPTSTMGIFKKLFIHIGDTQSLEFELSTYSSHLLHMKYFLENSNGKTLFFIDELGTGSDPNLGGAFAEVILQELCIKQAMGIVTTHYLNLKAMANNNKGIVNAAMAFDEKNLQPLYKLIIGKPGSSYTFAIAERIGLPKHLISRAKQLVDDNHFKLDKLLNNAEQKLHSIDKEKQDLQKLIGENVKLKKEMQQVLNKEKHQQQIELLKHQNRKTEQRIAELKELERKFRQVVLDYKKTDDKQAVIKNLHNLLFKKNETKVVNTLAKRVEKTYTETNQEIEVGMDVKLKKNYQIGKVLELRGKTVIVQVGLLPMHVNVDDVIAVKKNASK
jgi:DNA mismatch repair protein MutS2